MKTIYYDDVELMWHSMYYDGPLTGVLRYEGREHWFHCVESEWHAKECQEGWRKFVLVPIRSEDKPELYRRHALFENNVGTHTTYNDQGRREVGRTKSQEEWPKYYDEAKTWEKLWHEVDSESKAIAYFVWD